MRTKFIVKIYFVVYYWFWLIVNKKLVINSFKLLLN